jgi:hypothetical protein
MRCLALLLFVVVSVGSYSATPETSGATKGSPSIKGRASSEPEKRPGATEQNPAFVRLTEDPDDARRRQAREEKAEKREADDLIALQAAASAAQAQVGIASWTVVLSAIGTIALLVTILFSYRSVEHASAAAEAAGDSANAARANAESSRRQERAYVFVEVLQRDAPQALNHSGGEGEKNRVRIKFANLGNTPASVVRIDAAVVYNNSVPEQLHEDRPLEGVPVPIGIAKGEAHVSDPLFRLTTVNTKVFWPERCEPL